MNLIISIQNGLVTFLKHLGDDVELMRIWARSADESTLTGLYDKFVGLAEEMNEKDDTPLDAILAALLIAVCTIANSNDYSKATVLKAVYEIPWPAYNAPGGSGVN